MYLTWGVRLTKFLANMEESREESMIFDVYFPATVHAANTARELIVSRDIKKYQQGLWVMLLSAGQSRVIYSGALAHTSVAWEYSGDVAKGAAGKTDTII